MMHRMMVGLILALAWLASPVRAEVDEKSLLFAGESPYASIRVFETVHGYRALALGQLWQTVINPRDREEVFFAYSRSALAALALNPDLPREVLFVGLGGGSMATYLQRKHPGGRYTVAEIDPLVVELAARFFDFDRAKFAVEVDDGRRFLRKTGKRFDLVVLDAFRGDEVPFHLTTVEFMALLKARLRPDGVAAFHLWEAKRNRYFSAQLATIKQVFPVSYLFYAGDGSYLVFAVNAERTVAREDWGERGRALTKRLAMSYDLGAIVDRQYALLPPVAPGALILTDDYAPVNQLRSGE